MRTLKYPPHELATIFPPMTAQEKRDLANDIRKNGLVDPIILFDDQILDGRSRFEACLNADVEPRYINFDELPAAVKEAGPLSFVIARNMKRRHLTPSQLAIIAAETIPQFEKRAKERQQAGLAPTGANGEIGKSAEIAAKTLGASPRSVERARQVLKISPEQGARVKAGKLSLHKAAKEAAKKKPEKKKSPQREIPFSEQVLKKFQRFMDRFPVTKHREVRKILIEFLSE